MKPSIEHLLLIAIAAAAAAVPAEAQRAPVVQQPPALVTDAVAARTIRVRDVDLAYVEQGQGVPVVLLHGFLHDYRVWTSELASLSTAHRVVAYSQRHRWPTSPPPGGSNASPAEDLADLVAFIRALDLGPVHLVGHSAGASLALHMARAHPDLVRSLVLAEPVVPALLAGRDDLQPPFTPALVGEIRQAYEKGEQGRALEMLAVAVLGPDAVSQPAPPKAARIAADNIWQIEKLWSGDVAEPPFTCDDGRRIAVPVLLVGGDRSPAFFKGSLDELQKCLRAAERVTLPGSSHGLQLENAAAFDRAVLAFLARQR